MARFYGSTQGERGETTRLGHKRITAEARGWNSGVRVVGSIAEDGTDVFHVYATGGSNDPHGTLVGTLYPGGHFMPVFGPAVGPPRDEEADGGRGPDYDLARDMRRGK